MMMMVLRPKASSLAFTLPGDEMGQVVPRCLPRRHLYNLSKVATHWPKVDSNPRLQGTEHSLPYTTSSHR